MPRHGTWQVGEAYRVVDEHIDLAHLLLDLGRHVIYHQSVGQVTQESRDALAGLLLHHRDGLIEEILPEIDGDDARALLGELHAEEATKAAAAAGDQHYLSEEVAHGAAGKRGNEPNSVV